MFGKWWRRSRGRPTPVPVEAPAEEACSEQGTGGTWRASSAVFDGDPMPYAPETTRDTTTGYAVPADPHLREPDRPWRQP